ncbi:glycosyltransferase family 2 protein [Prochlorococcus marinus]|uniref:glycosyltransferase family 2 protein n=1 Tax=Prochlorococcus marinus TaxID=1219 RepID=UPI001AD98AA2|nr:glycosyltransferase family 2 protein [Prochlorococcus marinus]MBO8217666.1 glycosyltransferase family 2 protein [Prochlorococcus marinus XMU1405]MBW3040828.1 hypothetical protein [Prochlorococcus marinus str. MU1405]MBW3048287.1 hypothetical protein [Prochlorococcus marinus str. MU1406]
MELPLITIGISSYNASRTIERSVCSALSQSWRPIEIIIVDDCSNDGTYEKLLKMSSKYKDIRVFKNNKNYGIGFVRNLIIKKSRGKFLAFFDDDDESMPDRLKLQYKKIVEYEKHLNSSSLVICHSSRNVIYPNGKIRLEKALGSKNTHLIPFGKSVAKRILLGKPLKNGYGACPTCSQMARISTYHAVDGFDEKFRRSEDTDLCIRLAIKGAHFVGINQPLVLQKMTKTPEKNIDIEFKFAKMLLKKHKNFIAKYGKYEFCFDWQKIKYCFYKRDLKKFIASLLVLIMRYPKETLLRLFQSLRSIQLNIDYSLFHK